MAADPEPERARRRIGTGRLEAFSDGVFAIAITLLVLEISVPEGSNNDLLRAVLKLWPSYLAYVVSFATIGVAWLGHTVVTEYVSHTDATFARVNLLALMAVSFLPFPTALLAGNISSEGAERVATTIYGLNLVVVSGLLYALWRYAVHARLIRSDVHDDDVEILTKRLKPGLAGYAAAIVLGLLLPLVAVFGYLAIALYLLLPVRLRPDRHRPSPEAGSAA